MPDTTTQILIDPTSTPAAAGTVPAPVTNRPNQALYSGATTTQGLVVTGGSDYGATAKAQAAKVDQYGSQYVVSANPAGGSQSVQGGTAPGALGTQYGQPIMWRMDLPTPASWATATSDMQGALQVHAKSKPTFTCLAIGRTASVGGSLLSIVNGSASSVVRLQQIIVYVPPAGVSGALLGQGSTTYYPLITEIRRITSSTGGTSLTPVPADSGDALPSGIVVATGATVSTAYTTFFRGDAVQTTDAGIPFYGRGDVNAKTLVLRPGEGLSVTTPGPSVTVGTSTGGTATAVCDVLALVTVAPA